MIKKILYVAILIQVQSVFCMIPNKKNVINNNEHIIISTDNCCYPVDNNICNLFYAFCKTETLQKKSFFITKKKLTDLRALNKIINKKVDSAIIKEK
jgi:predicted transglutaminase-like cysteine proteinase